MYTHYTILINLLPIFKCLLFSYKIFNIKLSISIIDTWDALWWLYIGCKYWTRNARPLVVRTCLSELVDATERTLAYLSLFTKVSDYILLIYFMLFGVLFPDYLSSCLKLFIVLCLCLFVYFFYYIFNYLLVSVGQKHRITVTWTSFEVLISNLSKQN